MKQKGFTLVELLVVIVILGIITAISFPMIRNIRQGNELREYSTYQKSVRYAAKLYVDSYQEDLFGNEESGCAIIQFEDLYTRDLLKDIDLKDITCATEETYVRVVKIDGKYGYSVRIGCGKADEQGDVKISYRLPKDEIVSSDNCNSDATVIMTFQTNINNPTSLSYKKRSMKVSVLSSTGVNTNPIIQYGFSATQTPDVLEGWANLILNPSPSSTQKEKILNGETIEVISKEIETPKNLTGNYYLVLRVDRLQDLSGKDWTKEGNSNYVYLGPYTLDNTKPVFNNSRIVSSTDGYNALKPKLDLKVTDILAPNNKLKMCISYDSDTCSKKLSDIRNYGEYKANIVLDPIKDNLDGSLHKIYITVADPAGNYQTQTFNYELASVITYNGNNHTGGSTSKTYCNNNIDCTLRSNGFTRTGYNYTGWYTTASGGTKYGATTKLTGNITVYAHWDPISYKITYNLDSGSADNPATYTIETPTITLKNPSKTGYTFDGWTGSNGTTKQTTVKIEKGSTGDKSYTANYTIKKFKITYAGNGSTGGSTADTTCDYNATCTLRSNGYTRAGYNFEGWYTASSGGTKYGSTTQLTQDITVYAHWKAANPTCSGSCSFKQSGNNWELAILSTGTVNLGGKSGPVDIFIVGGGQKGGGYKGASHCEHNCCFYHIGVGGNGGKIITYTGIAMSSETNYSATIGGSSNGTSSITIGKTTYKSSDGEVKGKGGNYAKRTCCASHGNEDCSYTDWGEAGGEGVYAFGSETSLYRSGAKYGKGGHGFKSGRTSNAGGANTGNGGDGVGDGNHKAGGTGIIIIRNHR